MIKLLKEKIGRHARANRFLFFIYDSFYRISRQHHHLDFGFDPSHESASVARYSSVSILQTRLAIEALGSVEGLTFCDIGCGKGRVLLVAAEYPFRRILGVELFGDFAKIGQRNIDAWCEIQKKDHRSISLNEADATTFRYPAEDTVYYFFNPFPGQVFEKVLHRIEECRMDRRILLMIVHPVSDSYTTVLANQPYRLLRVLEHGFTKSLIYERV